MGFYDFPHTSNFDMELGAILEWFHNNKEKIDSDTATVIEKALETIGYSNNAGNSASEADRLYRQTLSLKEQVATTENNLERNFAQIEANRQAIAQIVQLPAGSTTGDAELMNIRVGDGRTYDTAGDAVRGQHTNLKHNIEDLTGNGILSFTYGYYIGVTGSEADTDHPVTSPNGFSYSVTPCQPGDVFTINGTGGSSGRLWAFLDSNKAVLTRASANKTENMVEHVAPERAAYIVVNLNSAGGGAYTGRVDTENRSFTRLPSQRFTEDEPRSLAELLNMGIQFVYGASYALDKPAGCPTNATLANIVYDLAAEGNGRVIQFLFSISSNYYTFRTVTLAGEVSIDWRTMGGHGASGTKGDWHVFGSSSEAGYYSYFDADGVAHRVTGRETSMYTWLANKWYFDKTYHLHAHGSQGFVAQGTYDQQGNKRNGVEELRARTIEPYSLVTIHYGAADYSDANVEIGTINSAVGSNTFYGKMKEFIELLNTKCPTASPVVVIKFFKCNVGSVGTHYSLNHSHGGRTYQDFVDAIINVCNYYGIPYIDWSKGTGFFNLLNAKQAMPDGLHLTKELNESAARLLIGQLPTY